MKQINHMLKFIFVFIGISAFAQTIELNACNELTENQEYIFNQKIVDTTGRNIFETSPVDEHSPCGGVGNCEFQIAWSQTNSRWEIYVDDGSGLFLNRYVLYYNTEATTPNPPSLAIGTWLEETGVTQSLCGVINSITGDVQDTILGVSDFNINGNISLFPNPSSDFIQILGLTKTENYRLYNNIGSEIISGKISDNEKLEIKSLSNGFYFLKFDDGKTIKFIKE